MTTLLFILLNKKIKFLGMELLDKSDFSELIVKFAFNFFISFVIIRLIYYPIHKRKDYLFTYFLFNILIFMVCILLNNVKLSIGFAFGLFAVFGILRYRTEQLPIKEMTYLFIVIALGIINALANKKISIAELAFTNFAILFATYSLEKLWLLRHETSRIITYEKIELIKPEKHKELMQDLRERTGLNIHKFTIERIDFLRDIARIRIFFYEDNPSSTYFEFVDNENED